MASANTPTRAPGLAIAIASGAVAIVALLVAVLPADGEPTQYSYPSSASTFVAYQVLYAIQHLVVAWAILAVLRSGAAGTGKLGAVGAWGSAVAFVVLGILEVIAALAATEPLDGPVSQALNTAYGVVTIPLGVFLILVGVAVVRAKVWAGWRRWVLLIAGIWVFVPLTPALAIDFTVARYALIGWMILFIGLGVALLRKKD